MSEETLLRCLWTGTAFEPYGPHQLARADHAFGAGELVVLNVVEERSAQSHRHQFAWINDAWRNLPERVATEPWAASPEHLRKRALIATGWHHSITWACGSKAEARRWAANLRPVDEYSLVVAQGTMVVRYTARSQSLRAMGKQDFQKSKDDILNWIAALLDVAPESLVREHAA